MRVFREAYGIGLREMARRLQVSPSLLSRAERGLLEPWPKLRRAAAEQLAVSEDILFNEHADDSR